MATPTTIPIAPSDTECISLPNPTSSPPSDGEDDLDEELEAAFDTPVEEDDTPQPNTPPPPSIPVTIPASPERKHVPSSQPARTILSSLLQNQNRLRGHAARLAQQHTIPNPSPSDINSTDNPIPTSIADAMRLRRSHAHLSQQQTMALEQQAKAGFRVARAASKKAANSSQRHSFVDTELSGMSLKDCPYTSAQLSALFGHATRVELAQVSTRAEDIRAGRLKEFLVCMCLVRKVSKKTTGKGGRYAVWRVCDLGRGKMEQKEVTLLLFDSAYEGLHTSVPGAVFVVRRPNVLPPKNGEEMPEYGLTISKIEHVFEIGVCVDFGLCGEETNMGACGKWFDRNRNSMCVGHERKRLTGLTRGMRMDINNAERPIPLLPKGRGMVVAMEKRTEELNMKSDIDASEAKFLHKKDKHKLKGLIKKQREIHGKSIVQKRSSIEMMQTEIRNKKLRESISIEQEVYTKNMTKTMGKVRETAVTQGTYEDAVRTLQKAGFILTGTGSLRAPLNGIYGLNLMKSDLKKLESIDDEGMSMKKYEKVREESRKEKRCVPIRMCDSKRKYRDDNKTGAKVSIRNTDDNEDGKSNAVSATKRTEDICLSEESSDE